MKNLRGDENGHAWVDLGLPSGLKWANMNVGAASETEPGLYFAWGETQGFKKETNHVFNFENYTCRHIMNNLPFSHDAARANMGGCWRMPTAAEIDELIDNTIQEWTTDYEGTGVAGYIVSSKSNSNKIFMPAAGYCYGSTLNYFGSDGYYWSGSQGSVNSDNGYSLNFGSGYFYGGSGGRCRGRSVRGVCR